MTAHDVIGMLPALCASDATVLPTGTVMGIVVRKRASPRPGHPLRSLRAHPA